VKVFERAHIVLYAQPRQEKLLQRQLHDSSKSVIPVWDELPRQLIARSASKSAAAAQTRRVRERG